MYEFRLIPDAIHKCGAPDEKPAFVEYNRSVTYGEARSEIDRLAAYLISAGFKPGERIAVLYPNSWAYVCSIYGVMKAGLIPAAFHPRIAPGEISRLMDISEPTGLLADLSLLRNLTDGFAPCLEKFKLIAVDRPKPGLVERVSKKLGREIVIIDDELQSAQPAVDRFPESDPDDGALIIFTTGTTGPPKGVLLSHRNILSVAKAIVNAFGVTSDDITLVGAALAHISSFTSQMVAYPMAGATCCIARGFLSMPREVLDFAHKWDVTSVHGMPTSLAMLINSIEQDEAPLPRLRYISLAGMRLTRKILDGIMLNFPGVVVFNSYGLTEASPRMTAFRVDTCPEKVASVGNPLPICEVSVVDGEDAFLPTGEVGELIVKSPGNMKGYFNDEESTRRAFIGEWMRTGDLASIDEDGFIYLESRKSEMINVGGEKVNPYEVEDVINAIEAVENCLVVKKPDDIFGEIPIALVKLMPGTAMDDSELLKRIKPMLSSFKMPMDVRFVDDFAKTGSGKLIRRLPEECS